MSSDLTDYYRSSAEYRAMLAEQDEATFAQYLSYFRRWARPGDRVLDVGCGVGTSTHMLREAGFEALGTDTSARFLPEGEGFFVADFARGTELPGGSFAAAGALNVIEHVADPRAFLDELVRVVRPGGLVVICSPNLTSPLVGARILVDLARRRTPYLGIGRPGAALALLARNLGRSAAAARGRDAFAPRADTLASGVIGYDADAIYWSNAAEVRRHLERHGCAMVSYQGEGRTLAARADRPRSPVVCGTAGGRRPSGGLRSRPDVRWTVRLRAGSMRILFANHTSAWSGGEVSLMRLLEGLRADHDVCVACPPDGRAGGRRGPRGRRPAAPADRGREPAAAPDPDPGRPGPAGLRRPGARSGRPPLPRRRDPREQHARGDHGVDRPARGGPPYVVRAHEHVPLTPRGRAVRGLIVRTAGGVAAVSDYTAAQFNEGLAQPVATRVYNSIDHARFNARGAAGARCASSSGSARTRRCSGRWPRSPRGRGRTWRSDRWRECGGQAWTRTWCWPAR